ncbi:MAG: signal peptide peptidase SppA [Calditrichaeota bacterium]|nr:MAG: signal peptide peptidase SppA [Calditrichota bacterium]
MRIKEWQKIALVVVLTLFVGVLFYTTLFRVTTEVSLDVKPGSFLQLNLSGEIPERVVENPIAEVIGGLPNISIQDIVLNIHKAKRDKNISGILLHLGPLGIGWGKLDEIRNALQSFHAAGKKIYTYLEMAGDAEYYLASVSDTITTIPTAIFMVNGLVSEPLFMKGTLQKLGIEADFVAHGKYKNAPDIFTRESMSDAQREVLNAILDEYYQRLVDTLSVSRGLSRTETQSILDKGLLNGREALAMGLVDTLMYFNELKTHLTGKDDSKRRILGFKQYRKVQPEGTDISTSDALAIVYGVGSIVIGGEKPYEYDNLITSEGMANSIRKAAENKRVKAIILRIDSPGGSGVASDVIWKEVVKAREKKPIIVSISDLAASGGYYISMAADTIVAHPGSIVGSIGVFAGKFAMGKFYNKIGMNTEKLQRGRNADFFLTSQPFTPEQRKILRHHIMTFYEDFLQKVAQGRHMSVEEVDKIAQGRIWSGKQGYQNGLVDVLGDFNTAVRIAKEMANLPVDKPVPLLIYPRIKSFWERLLLEGFQNFATQPVFPLSSLPEPLQNMVKAIPYFQTGEPLFLPPFIVDIN